MESDTIHVAVRSLIVLFYLQVSNPSIQFMLYEILLKKLRRHRALLSKDGAKGVTALEVSAISWSSDISFKLIIYKLWQLYIDSDHHFIMAASA